jgi:dipeptidase E
MSRVPQVVAFGGGGFSMESCNAMLDDYVLAATGVERPKVCFLPTASGDADHYIVRFYRHFPATRCEPSHVSLFRRDCGAPDPATHLLEQDLIYVGGGCVRSMLGAWRAHGLDDVLREAWQAGIVLAGLSAGSMCWFEWGLTTSVGTPTLTRGLGFLPGSNSVHYDGEPERRPVFLEAVRSGTIPGGWGADDGAALLFKGARVCEVVSSRPHARAYHVARTADGVLEDPIEPRQLPRPPKAATETELAIGEFRGVNAARRAGGFRGPRRG